ncbi:hypothetical protein GGI35DRAFT_487408 [Trichoderma velutinum]
MGMPRERSMPLVPEPFSRVTIPQVDLFMDITSMAERWGIFCPNLDILQYRESLSEEKKAELEKRAFKLAKRATANQIYSSSEFCWEVSAWNDVFGPLYDDERFRMDKKPYEFLEVDQAGDKTVKKRIPDATIGLRSYDDDSFLKSDFQSVMRKLGYISRTQDCKEDDKTMQPDWRLHDQALHSMMSDPECGLVVDGTWGKTELLFPFAVYEAKKRATNDQQAEDQIYHACRTYLAMLDDLARNPDNVAEYQTEESSKYQLFAFTSCGSDWQVFIAWNRLRDCDCRIKTIWTGDVRDCRQARDLICIVDQIQDYAVHHHRPFVMNHLEAWHTRHQRTKDEDPYKNGVRKLEAARDLKGDVWFHQQHIELLKSTPIKSPEWSKLKLYSKFNRQEIANETRRRNRSLREAARFSETAKEAEIALARGRPPKTKVIKTTMLSEQKRPRGRPAKAKVIKTTKLSEQRRPRGRPPKAKLLE